MRQTKIVTFLLAVIIISCKHLVEKTKKNYELMSDDDGILVEKFDSIIVDENKYNKNNTIYKVGTIFTYDFKHFTSKNKLKYFKINDDRKSWSFVNKDARDSTIIKSVIIEVADGNPMAKHIPDYNQTVLRYKFIDRYGYSMSGAIENEGNVWIHPPRDKYFKILELNPFPYIKYPYEIGTKWTWNLKIGDSWADTRWKMWQGKIENKYQYEIIDIKNISTNLGNLECYVINSNAKSRIGETSLTSYFNLKYGFVKLDYTNIDGSKTILELVKHFEM